MLGTILLLASILILLTLVLRLSPPNFDLKMSKQNQPQIYFSLKPHKPISKFWWEITKEMKNYRRRGGKGSEWAKPVLVKGTERLERPKVRTQKAPTMGNFRRNKFDDAINAIDICSAFYSICLFSWLKPLLTKKQRIVESLKLSRKDQIWAFSVCIQ